MRKLFNGPEITDPPWAMGTSPTPHQMLPWFLVQSTEAQLWLLSRWLHDTQVAGVCFQADHENHIRHLEYRLAEERR